MKQNSVAGARVLLIEDEAFIRGTIRRLLISLHCAEVQEAADGTEALQRLDAGFRPHLVLCDVQMAPMDGLAFLRAVRALDDPERSGVAVVMLTAVADKTTIEDTKGLNIAGYLLKPVSRTTLSDRLETIFRRAEPA